MKSQFALKMMFAASVAALGVVPAAHADTNANNAYGIDAHLESETVLSHFGPLADVSHVNNGPYDKTISVATVNEDAPIAAGTLPPYFFIDAKTMSSEVKNTLGVDTVYTQSNASVGRATLTMNINPPPGVEIPIPYPALLVKTSGVSSQASYSNIVVGPTSVTGSATIQSLKITGTLLDKTVTYSGDAPPNTVIYDGPHVTITLNRQLQEGTVVCSPGCAIETTGIRVSAIEIRLHNAQVDGHTISGRIILGGTVAE